MDYQNRSFRASFTFPAKLAVDIAHVARRLGVSQSALVAQLLGEPVGVLKQYVDDLPPFEWEDDSIEAKRGRGASLFIVTDRIQDALGKAGYLDVG